MWRFSTIPVSVSRSKVRAEGKKKEEDEQDRIRRLYGKKKWEEEGKFARNEENGKG